MAEHKNENSGIGASPPLPRDYRHLFYDRLTETHLFCDVGRIIASELEPTELIQKIVTSIGKAISFEDASVYIVKKDLTGLVPIYFHKPLALAAMPALIYFDNGAPGAIAANGEPTYLDGTAHHEIFLHYPGEPRNEGSYIGIPLKNENRIVGVMGFSSSKPAAFSVKDFDLLRTLSYTISAGLEKAELLKRTLEISRYDELTGMLNYRMLMDTLEKEVGRQVRTGGDFSFIMIDIDDFKRVNDRYGHLEGSRVIAQMGALFREEFRTGSTDTCFRYGGDEFSILLGETGFDQALTVAERVRKSVEEYPFTLKAAHSYEVLTVSQGVSIKRKGDQKTIPKLIQESDIALYHSKHQGKNRVTGFREGLSMPGTRLDPGVRIP